MKRIFKQIIIILLTLLTINNIAGAQCTPPDLSFVSPTLVAGVALQEGAVYKFANVNPGIDCYITLVKFNGGATLISMENVGLGYNDAWQPIINGPGAPVGNKSWIDWKIAFKTTAGVDFAYPCLAICAIDVDGDNGNLGEVIESDGQASYGVPIPTLLTITDRGNGRIEAQGPTTNRAGIDTLSLDVRINYYFDGSDTVKLKIGQTVLGPGTGGATQRFNCIYFKTVNLNPFMVLPLGFVDVEAKRINNNLHHINWKMADNSLKAAKFDVEYSEDNIKWQVAASLPGENEKADYNINYQNFSANTVYYRIRGYESNGKSFLSSLAIIKKIENEQQMKVSPNPADDYINVYLPETNAGNTRRIQLINLKGNKLIDMAYLQPGITINTTQLLNGYYVVKVIDRDKIFSSQILIKHP